MTTATVVIGHGARDDRHRTANRRWVSDRYTAHGYDVRVGVCSGRWRKAAAYNPAAADCDADVLVIADADCVVDRAALELTVDRAAHDGYAVPAIQVRRITPDATAQVLAADPSGDLDNRLPVEGVHQLLEGGGIVAVRRDLWREVGGFDPRFVGWGGEDYALGCALYAATGLFPRRAPGVLIHLWHPPQGRNQRMTPANERLANRYRRAKHDPDAMRQLLAEARHATT